MTEQQLLEKMKTRAYNLLAAKPRSEAELRQRLLEKQWAEQKEMESAVEAVIARLKELRYLDDELFAYDFVRSRVGAKPLGKNRVARDLARKKVPRDIAKEALDLVYDEAKEDELIDKAIEHRVRVKGRPTSREEAKKLFDHLVRLGFSFDLVSRKVRALGRAEIDEDVE